jgi:hypothetical protein
MRTLMFAFALASIVDGCGRGLDIPAPPVRDFTAALTGDQVIPPVSTTASGSADFHLNQGPTAVDYSITLLNLPSAESASLHVGTTTQNRTASLTLCAPCSTTIANVRVTGTASVSAALVTSMRAFGTYVEVRTASGPVLRGQVRVVIE